MTTSEHRPRPSLRRQILVRGSFAVLLAMIGLLLLLGLSARMRSRLSSAVDAFVEEQLIANRISQAVMRQLVIVSSGRAQAGRPTRDESREASHHVYDQLRLYLFRDLTFRQRLQLESIQEEHQRLEVAAARAADLLGRGDREEGTESFEQMSGHALRLLEALDVFVRMREADLQSLRRTQQSAFRAMYAVTGVFGFVLLVGSVALMRFLFGRVDRPLSDLKAAARRMEAGDLDVRVLEPREEEFAVVASSFNRMAERVREREEKVRALNLDLEQRVARRTAALRASEERFRTLAATAHDAIVTADEKGKIAYFNPGAERIFGYAASELIGRCLTMLMPERFHEPHRQGLARFLATGEARFVGRTVELVGRRKDGSEFPLEISLGSRRSDGALALIGIIRDITQRQETEQKLTRYAAELEATNKELEAFSYSVSHDLRAPLRSIHGFSRAVLEDHADRLDEQGVQDLHRVCKAAERMGLLIDDLLALSRAARAEMRDQRVDLGRLAEQIAAELGAAEPERRVDADIREGLFVLGDQRLLALMVRNLVENAWKFTAKRDPARIEVGRTDTEEPAFFVRDNGVGFDDTYADKLFQPFQRLHPSRDFPGTGIGLALVQRIVHRHGGRVWAEGQVDRGATFYFTLPGVRSDGH